MKAMGSENPQYSDASCAGRFKRADRGVPATPSIVQYLSGGAWVTSTPRG